MVSADWRIKGNNGEVIRTKRYFFHKKVSFQSPPLPLILYSSKIHEIPMLNTPMNIFM